MSVRRWLLVALVAFLAWQWLGQRTPSPAHGAPASTNTAADRAAAVPDDADTRDGLPPEARATLALIARGGPFPYERDGIVFGNFEQRLPEQPRGYYREYTVPTPGESGRGARRIVTGGDPPRVFYYSDDHYESFRQIEGGP
jgi:guanyl-specific ribonuclease Sa